MRKMSEHGNGIALVFNRCDSSWFHEYVFNRADALLFLQKRVKFVDQFGKVGNQPGAGAVLIAYGADNVSALLKCKLKGKFIRLENNQLVDSQLKLKL